MTARWMIYGATGFTGRLIARRAKQLGLEPVLAGRRRDAVEQLGRELGMPTACFPIEAAAEHTRGLAVVLHCAGPFVTTAAPMLEACIANRASYLDITGELAVLEHTFSYDARARAAGATLVSGAGCDVIPSDCLARHLALALPDATHLELANVFSTTPSTGTLGTFIDQIPLGGWVIRDGKRVKVAHAAFRRRIAFPDKPRYVASAPWGDLITAQRASGIPNVTVYMAMPRVLAWYMRATSPFSRMTAWRPMRWLLRKIAFRFAAKDEPQADGWLYWSGEARKGDDLCVAACIRVPDPFTFTALSTVAAVQRLLAGGVPAGALTPSQAFGDQFALSLPGVELIAGRG